MSAVLVKSSHSSWSLLIKSVLLVLCLFIVGAMLALNLTTVSSCDHTLASIVLYMVEIWIAIFTLQ